MKANAMANQWFVKDRNGRWYLFKPAFAALLMDTLAGRNQPGVHRTIHGSKGCFWHSCWNQGVRMNLTFKYVVRNKIEGQLCIWRPLMGQCEKTKI